jgi:hypothetical protein
MSTSSTFSSPTSHDKEEGEYDATSSSSSSSTSGDKEEGEDQNSRLDEEGKENKEERDEKAREDQQMTSGGDGIKVFFLTMTTTTT